MAHWETTDPPNSKYNAKYTETQLKDHLWDRQESGCISEFKLYWN